MSNNSVDLEKLISESHIEKFEYSNFKNIKHIGKDNTINPINESIVEGKDDDLIENCRSDTKSSDEIPDINEDLSIGSSISVLNIDKSDKSEINTRLQISKSVQLKSKNSLSSIEAIGSSSNVVELKFEVDGLTSDEKAKELITKLTEIKYLYTLKLLFEDLKNEFSDQVLIDSLVALADSSPFDLYYSKESVARLELHLRAWIAVLERICSRICFSSSPICFTKKLRVENYSSLVKFAEIHQKAIEELEIKSFKPNFNQQKDNDDEKIANNQNYNIDFLLIHIRDTLHFLHHDETWIQKIIRKTIELLKAALNITPRDTILNDNCSILSILDKLRQDISIKYPVASYYIDWRIMLIIQHQLFIWCESPEEIINRKFGERILMEYFWSYLEREWINVADKSILDFQPKFDEASNKLAKSLRNTGGFLNELTGNEPLALPHTLWFGILDLAQNLIQRSTKTATYGLCYYLAIESLNKAPSSFIQFKAIEILLHLHNTDHQMFSMIEVDFDQYSQKLNKNKSTYSSENFQNLLMFVKEKFIEDFRILNYSIGKGKGKGKENSETSNYNILDVIADEMTCPISKEPTDLLCILKCQHILSLNNFKRLKQKECPKCREKIEYDKNIRYLPQNTIHKNLHSQFIEAGLISHELEDSDQTTNGYDSDDSEISNLTKIKHAIKPNSNRSIQSFFQFKSSKKPLLIYQNIIKELEGKNYEKAETLCKESLKSSPKNYSILCILAYINRCLNNYKQAHLYLKKAINFKKKEPIAYFIRGTIYFRQNDFKNAINDLENSIKYKAKINNLHVILENCYKNYAYICEKQNDYSNTLKTLDKLLNINKKDSLILCYYGEILSKKEEYVEAITYFTEANIIDPENVHNLNKKAIAYFILRKYDEMLSDLNKVIQFNPNNSIGCIAYFYKWLAYYEMGNISNTTEAYEKCTELDVWSHLYEICKFDNYDDTKLGIVNKFDMFMYGAQNIYFVSNIINLNDELRRFQEEDSNSLSGNVLSFKDEAFDLILPIMSINIFYGGYILWKINIKKILSRECFVKFIIKSNEEEEKEYILKGDDLLKLEGLGWIEYKFPYKLNNPFETQPLIKSNGFIDMQIDYFRYIPYDKTYEELIYFTKINHLSSIHNLHKRLPNIPEAFNDKYFFNKDVENLFELNDIINYL
ncbi:hypothetical protein C1645_806747 [Glomus cerebriforme]|uniref:Uncharacterized protein n=1 Tax=Glomus cerebriforme TaxID=658196 RepID=A0A397SV77_9GLOM|nr:hypothetical protein C1645_806747 [Glomus cerebriforme]